MEPNETENTSVGQRILSIGQKERPTEWEKIFSSSTSDRELASKLCKEFKKLDIKNSN